MGLCSSSELKEDLYPATPSSSTTIKSTTTRGSTRAPSTSSPRASKTSSSSSGGTQFSSYADSSTDADPPSEGLILPAPNLKVFAYSDLRAATKGFRPDSILGEGGFGAVYKGWLDEKTFAPSKAGSGMPVAVKKLHEESIQGLKEWESEINFLGRLSHPNLVRLIGYSWDERELLLVYEYMQRGSLENHLFRRSSSSQDTISWRVRIRILIDAARALAFLHTSEKQVIYRDFKASNILLDANYNAKISDFGLAKNGPEGSDSHVSTRIMGTFGYAAPEYVATGHLYVKSDVYGFGVVLLEMISGLRAMDKNRPGKEQNLIEWLRPYLNDKKKLLSFVMDQRLEGKYPPKAAIEAAKLTLSCLEPDPKNRPHMKNVVEKLEYIVSIRDKSPGESQPIPQGGPNGQYYQRQHQHHPRSPSKSPKQPGRAMRPRMDLVGNGIYGNQRSATPR